MVNEGRLWSFFRALISQGTYIQMDYAAGKFKCYEEFSARLDEAARERVDQFLHGREDPPLGMEAHMAERLAKETSVSRDFCTSCGMDREDCALLFTSTAQPSCCLNCSHTQNRRDVP